MSYESTGCSHQMTMLKLALPLIIAVAGCVKPPAEFEQCERYIKSRLKAPSSYKLIGETGSWVPYDKRERYVLSIEYDAQNSYGVMLRDTQICIFPGKDGKPDTSQYIDFEQAWRTDPYFEDAADRAMEEAEAAAEQAVESLSDPGG